MAGWFLLRVETAGGENPFSRAAGWLSKSAPRAPARALADGPCLRPSARRRSFAARCACGYLPVAAARARYRSSTKPIAASIVMSVVSRITASAAGLSGAAARPASRASRSRISRKRLSMCNGDSFFDQLLMPAPRPLLGAGRHEHLERGVREHDRAHVAPVGDEPRRPRGRPAGGRAAPCRTAGWTATRDAAALTVLAADRRR